MARSRRIKLSAGLIKLVRELKSLKAAARKLGLFAEDRELLTCPRCGLQEDVDIRGMLLVTAPGNRHCDTGLRLLLSPSEACGGVARIVKRC